MFLKYQEDMPDRIFLSRKYITYYIFSFKMPAFFVSNSIKISQNKEIHYITYIFSFKIPVVNF